jgi:sigma-B regulation protein RsbU (phosphoserine phosphatase)
VLDVSGHGVAAALLSVTVSRFLSSNPDPSSMLWRPVQDKSEMDRGLPSQHDFQLETPARVAERLSQRFPFESVTGQFFTMVYGILDTHLHELRYTSAGHPNLLLVTARGDARALDATGYPIGVGPGDYEEQTFPLAPGDRIYIHSDGLTEAMNPSGELFGIARMLDVLRAARADSINDSLETLSKAICEWTRSSERRDDQTVLAVERIGG